LGQFQSSVGVIDLNKLSIAHLFEIRSYIFYNISRIYLHYDFEIVYHRLMPRG